jgi:replicative DNA helicase
MLDSGALNTVIDIITPNTFYNTSHQLIYEAIVDLFNLNTPVDVKTVVNQLRKNGKLEQVGGIQYVQQLVDSVVSVANIEYHAFALVEYSIRRDLILTTNEIQRSAYDDTIDVFELLDKSELKLFSIASNNIKRNYSDIGTVFHETLNEIKAKRNNNSCITGVPSGFRSLDLITSGWQKSDLIIVAARPGMGKTAFMLSLIRNAAIGYKIPVAMFSLEMSSTQLLSRMVAAESELDSEKIRKGQLEDYEWQQLIHKTAVFSDAQIYIDDTPALSVYELRAKCRRLKKHHQIKLVVVDYLQLLVTDNTRKTTNREQEISYISRSLKSLAKELDIPVIAPSQLSRAVEVRGGDKRPVLSDLRESGAIEQDADIVMFLYRPEYYGITENETGDDTKGLTEIIVAKHRNGPLGTATVKFIGRYVKFENI